MSPKMKHSMSVFWHATMRGCTLAIGVLFLFLTIMAIATSASGKNEQGLTLASMLTLTAFSLVISYAKEVFRAKNIPSPAQWLLNFCIIGLAYFLVILRSGMIANTRTSFYVTGILLYVLVYLLVLGIAMLVKCFTGKKACGSDAEGEEEYVNRFSNT